jgi:hypothetical protein
MSNIRKITILLAFISLLNTATAAGGTAADVTVSPEISWFHQKYLKERYDRLYVHLFESEYYDSRYCLELHKPAVMAAFTGTTFIYKHRVRAKMPSPVKYWKAPQSHFTCVLNITFMDFVRYITRSIGESTYNMFQLVIMILYLTLTITVTILVMVMFFGQY